LKKLPQRTCMGCNAKKEKKELIRIVKNSNGEINIDPTGKMEGRGTYICKNEECLNKVIKNKRITKVFEKEITNETYERIREYINGGEFFG